MTPTEADAMERLTVAILLGFTSVSVALVGAFASFPGTIAAATVSLITIVAALRYDRSESNTVRLAAPGFAQDGDTGAAARNLAQAATDGGQEVEA